MDDELSFSDDVSDICKKASQKVGVLARLGNLISCETKLHLYLTAIIPNLTYCHAVWHFCKASDRRKLERVQERALIIIFNSKKDTYDALVSRAKLPYLHNWRLQDIAILMFKLKNGLAPDYIMGLFRHSNKCYCLRNADFDLPRFSSFRYEKHSIRYLGPYLWSKLGAIDKNRLTISNFKKNIRDKDFSALIADARSNCFICTS